MQTNCNAKADQTTNTSNVTTPSTRTGTLSGRDPDETESSLTDTLAVAETLEVATSKYIYYRIYVEDGAIPSTTPASPSDPFLGRIKGRSVPPPHPRTANAVKRCIAKMEKIKDLANTSLFLTPYSQSPMDDADEVDIFDRTGPGSTPHEPLALVAKMSDSERSALESGGRGELAVARTTPPEIRYLYYVLYDDCEIPSKVAFDPEDPSIGRIRADSVAPPHNPTSIKRRISSVEGSSFDNADLFADILCATPLKEGHISILRTDGPGLSPNEPMAVVVPVTIPIPDGKYVIHNKAADIYWIAGHNPIQTVYFWLNTLVEVKKHNFAHWDITHDTNGNIFMTSSQAPSSWVGAEITGSAVPVPWRLIPADRKYYYFTTDINGLSQNPRVPVASSASPPSSSAVRGTMANLKEGDQWQMWGFIRI